MAGGENDSGLELRLPWGPVHHSAPTAPEPSPPVRAPLSPTPDEPAATAATSETGLIDFPASSFATPPAPPSVPPGPGADADSLRASLERLLVLVEERLDQVAELGSRGVHQSERPENDGDRSELARRLDRVETLVVASHDATIEAAKATDGGPKAIVAALDGRLARMEARGVASGTSSLDAVAKVGPALARLAQRLDDLEIELHTQLEKLDGAIGSVRHAVLQAMANSPSAELIGALQASVLTTGEHLDAELIDIKRLVAGQRLPH